MALMSLVKIFLILVGTAFTFWFFLTGLIKRDRQRIGKAVKVIISVACLVLLLTIGEFVYAFSK